MTPVSIRTAALFTIITAVFSGQPSAATSETVETRASGSALPVVEANDNRTPAGVLANDTLRIALVVKMARWYPEDPSGAFAEVAAFAEEGKAPQVPGPLIRVPDGTTIVATVRNDLADSTVWVRSLATRPLAAEDSAAVRPGETRTFSFAAGAPGTYMYYATAGIVNYDQREREQLAGAFVIDRRGDAANDRILMINIWGEPIDSTHYRNAVAINGKSWPKTERLTANVGDSVRWRIINASIRPHPMHLHGFYYRLDSRGTWLADTVIAPDRRPLLVTNNMTAASTMSIVWSPDRPGNWLFHCHLVFHVLEDARLDGKPEEHGHASDPMKHMAGLVLGITVRDPNGLAMPPRGKVRTLRLFAQEKPRKGRTPLMMSYVLQRDKHAPASDSVELPGAPIVLTRGQPTAITVLNRSHTATSVHWHGIELESFSDGVAGWSGADTRLAPMIAPNDSFIARLTLPRAGTFIYHTHLNDVEQLTSGLYGPVIVLEPGQNFDPETDHVFTLGWDGDKDPPHLVVNGDSAGTDPLVLKKGRKHRFRFINIGAAGAVAFGLREDSVPVKWRPLAKDGADLPPALRGEQTSLRAIATGETFDAEWTPEKPGEYWFTLGRLKPYYYKRKLIVR
jgi:FtsP/CotA-like multicopper oxidase with cupredoxin domain